MRAQAIIITTIIIIMAAAFRSAPSLPGAGSQYSKGRDCGPYAFWPCGSPGVSNSLDATNGSAETGSLVDAASQEP